MEKKKKKIRNRISFIIFDIGCVLLLSEVTCYFYKKNVLILQ